MWCMRMWVGLICFITGYNGWPCSIKVRDFYGLLSDSYSRRTLFYELSYPSTCLYWKCSIVKLEVHTSGLPDCLGGKFLWWSPTVWCPQCGTWLTSLFCRLEFWGDFYIFFFWKSVYCCLELWVPCLVYKFVPLICFYDSVLLKVCLVKCISPLSLCWYIDLFLKVN
jgi:hypothetical protein